MKVRVAMNGLAMMVLGATAADARSTRRLFEPTDLEWEEPGRAELDLQFGAIRGPSAFRWSVPDAEFDLGITRQLELDLDGAFALEGPDDATWTVDHLAPDNVWLALKSGLFSLDLTSSSAVATGLQVGPKLPAARGARGIGVETLVVIGLTNEHRHLVANLGALLDPIASSGRPRGFEGGIDLDYDLNDSGTWAWLGEIGAVRFISRDPYQLHVTSGLGWSPIRSLSLSAVLLCGLTSGSDRYGVLLGVSPNVRLFGG